MRIQDSQFLFDKLFSGPRFSPVSGHVDLTYRCNLRCVHCYCQGAANVRDELSSRQWFEILDAIHAQGCLWLDLSGGEPLLREDFLDIYAYTKAKGILPIILTNGQLFDRKIIAALKKRPPYAIEITLNGITAGVYESITRIPGSFEKVTENISRIVKAGLPLRLKANCLKQNKHQIGRIKRWADKKLGRSKRGFRFGYDPYIYPRLDGDKTPCRYRCTPEELSAIRNQDPEMALEYRDFLLGRSCAADRPRHFLYHCNAWLAQFVVSPSGRLKFCHFTEKFSSDLKTVSFQKGFRGFSSRILKQQFKTDSKCRTCAKRTVCIWCPAKACLETGNEERPVDYYCRMTDSVLSEKKALRS